MLSSRINFMFSVHFLFCKIYVIDLIQGHVGAGVDPSCDGARGRVHGKQVTNLD